MHWTTSYRRRLRALCAPAIRIAAAATLLPAPLTAQTPAPDLHTIELIPTPDLRAYGGMARLIPAPSPFTTPVTAAGEHRYTVILDIDSLPDPATLGEYTHYVVWATPPTLRPMQRLGALPAGNSFVDARVGEVAFNRFLLLISAERDSTPSQPSGRYVMRGLSPSTRLGVAHTVQAAVAPPAEHEHAGHANGWEMPPPHPRASPMYMPGLAGLTPDTEPFLPGAGRDIGAIPLARPRTLLTPQDGDTIRLEAGLVRRDMRGRPVVMYAFNGQHPGPLVQVNAGATVHVNFVNRAEHETAVHWHGVRLDNRFDGVPHLTQPPVAPGDSFHYTVRFPDTGVFWYHPHHREDIQQDLGLYGNLMVADTMLAAVSPAHREAVLMLDDLLLGGAGLIPYGSTAATHALMGRFGNVFLVNGEPAPSYRLQARAGEIVRLYLTNVANTRTFNVSLPGTRMKIVGGDIGRFEREQWVESVVIAPAERYIVDVVFDQAGQVPLLNRVQAIDHTLGVFFSETDTLAVVEAAAASATTSAPAGFGTLHAHDDVTADIARYRPHFARPPDVTLTLTMEDRALPFALTQLLRQDTLFFNPVEWSGTMPMMDLLPTSDQVRWVLRDAVSGLENEDIAWRFRLGQLVRVRLVNDRHSLHAMAHPIHIHGQRFLVLDVNGRPTENHVWKDTILVPVGGVVELLLEVSNPGLWMIHCHIAEHLEAGMKTVFSAN